MTKRSNNEKGSFPLLHKRIVRRLNADFPSTPMQGKGLRPWRLSTEQSRLFCPAMIMREEEDRYKQKVMSAAGLYIDDQAPIAEMVSTNAGTSATETAGKSGQHTGSAAKTSPTGDRGNHGFTGDTTRQDDDGPRGDRLVGDSPGAAATAAAAASADDRTSDVHRQNASGVPDSDNVEGDGCLGQGRGKGGGEEAGGRACDARSQGEPHGLEFEDDVRKRVLDLVRTADHQHTFETGLVSKTPETESRSQHATALANPGVVFTAMDLKNILSVHSFSFCARESKVLEGTMSTLYSAI